MESFQVAVSSIDLIREYSASTGAPSGPSLRFFNQTELVTDKTDTLLTAENALDPEKDKFYVDFMTAAGREKITQAAEYDSTMLGDYNWVSLGWAKPFRVRASASIGDGKTVYTKPGTTEFSKDDYTGYTTMLGDVLTGPAQTAIVMKNNGGTLFHLLKPLSLTKEDLSGVKMIRDTGRTESGKPIDTLIAVPIGQLQVMLVFNPDQFITAFDSISAENYPKKVELMGPNGVGNFTVPFLDATPVPYRKGDVISRETYLFAAQDQPRTGETMRISVDLYFNGSNIVAASTRSLVGPKGEFPVFAPIPLYVSESSDGITLEDNKHNQIVKNLKRLAAAGDKGSADLVLDMVKAPATGYTLVEKSNLN